MTTYSQQQLIERQFSPHSDAYLRSAVHASGPDLVEMERILTPLRPVRALDVGCGGGHASYLLARVAQDVVAFDLSPAMLQTVAAEADRRGFQHLQTCVGEVCSLPFPANSFDVVVTRYSAHHWENLPAALAEMHRVLRPGGTLLVSDVVAPAHPLSDTWLQSLELLRDPSHVRDYSAAEWKTKLKEAGFSLGTETLYRGRLDFTAWIARMSTPPLQVEAIRALQQLAPSPVSQHFDFEADGSFCIDTMLIPCVRG